MFPTLSVILRLLLVDALFVGLLLLAMIPLVRHKRAAFAVLKRNFVGYFSNPTGYVFLCVFVTLSSLAAFVPHQFFHANLANLAQLNEWMPFIMLVFIPAITMSIWSLERQQGTDELLLTLPASDFDIVAGKYLAAAAIFTASLLFSQLSNLAVLAALAEGELDTGLLLANYFGYWMVGLAMLSIGMVASFLTNNLTIGFILGAIFNAPLVLFVWADTMIPWTPLARAFSRWSISAQLDDYGRGVISLSATTYFLILIGIGLYLSMVLIGRRHWRGGRDGQFMSVHYLSRIAALMVIALGLNVILSNHDLRYDATAGKVSSLSADTKELIRNLEAKYPIYIEAFVSGEVPEMYVQTKYDLISRLKEFQRMAAGGVNINVAIHDDLEPFSEEAALADERFGIEPQTVRSRTRGAIKDDEVILGAAFTCGLEKVVVPFFDYGVPVEYELTRSISTVARGERMKVGVVQTDARLFGGFTIAGGMPQQIQKQEIIDELQKQYDVEEADASSPIEEGKYDVLLAVQPSSLDPAGLDNLIDAVRQGQPTAIFEDPRPEFLASAPATGEPKPPLGGGMGGMMGGGGAPQPKGDIRQLWDLLGVESPGEVGYDGLYQPEIVWQDYMPYRKLQVRAFPEEWVFASNDACQDSAAAEAINREDRITKGLDEIFFPAPGVIKPKRDSELKFTPLVSTSELAGTIRFQQYMDSRRDPTRRSAARRAKGEQILAARIQGFPEEDTQLMSDAGSPDAESDNQDAAKKDAGAVEDAAGGEKKADQAGSKDAAATEDAAGKEEKSDAESKKKPINVVYVADIDLMHYVFLRLRARPDEDTEINWRFENVTFILNIIDVLSGDDKYVEIRKRKPRYSTLRKVEARTLEAREREADKRLEYQAAFDQSVEEAEEASKKAAEELQKIVDDLKKKQEGGEVIDPAELQSRLTALEMKRRVADRRLETERERLQRKFEDDKDKIRRETDLEIEKIKNEYKVWAVGLPPIPPLFIGLIVWVCRRLREREGVSKSRLR